MVHLGFKSCERVCVLLLSSYFIVELSLGDTRGFRHIIKPHKTFVSILLNSSLTLRKWIILITTCFWLEPDLTQDTSWFQAKI